MRHTDDEMRAMVRKYTMEQTSITSLSEHHRLDHVVQELKFMIAENFGFNSFDHMQSTLAPTVSTLSFAERHNLQRRLSDSERRKG